MRVSGIMGRERMNEGDMDTESVCKFHPVPQFDYGDICRRNTEAVR